MTPTTEPTTRDEPATAFVNTMIADPAPQRREPSPTCLAAYKFSVPDGPAGVMYGTPIDD